MLRMRVGTKIVPIRASRSNRLSDLSESIMANGSPPPGESRSEMVEPAGYAPASAACKAAVLLLNEGPVKLARRPGAAPDPRSFGDSAAQAGARRVLEMERPAGIAPASPDWHTRILLLNDGRMKR